jgi:folate-binding protein YgfZ
MAADGAQIDALRGGRAYADLSSWWKVSIWGRDALTWLNDLVTADVGRLEPGRATRSLLLTPKGRIRADFTVARLEDGLFVVQDPTQPTSLIRALEPYVLSSEVALKDRTEETALLSLPEARAMPQVPGAIGWRPSCLGPGTDVGAPTQHRDRLREAVSGLVEAGPPALEAWRIERGVARLGADLTKDSLPHEAALDEAVAFHKGCFLGQEAAARVRNLGHPPFVVLAARSPATVKAREDVLSDGAPVGTVTSASPTGDGSAAIIRVRWAARDRPLRTAGGADLVASGPASG